MSPVGVSAPYPQHSGIYIPEIWSTKLQIKFYEATVLGAITNTDYEGEIANMGDKVKIRTVPDVTISPYTKGMTLNYEDLQGTLIELDIDQAYYFAFRIDNIDKYQSDLALLDRWAEDASERQKIQIDSNVLSNIDADVAPENTGNTAGALSGDIDLGSAGTPVALTKLNVLDYIVDHGTVLDENNVPETGRWFVIPPKISGLIKKSDLQDASLAGDGTSILRNGRLGMIDRYTLYGSNLLPVAAGVWTIYSGTQHAVTFASQITEMDHLEKLESTFGQAMRGLQVYGYKVIKPEAFSVGYAGVS